MAWNSIIGQSRIKKILQRALIERRIGSAYLLWGNEGVGKDAIALEFAKALNCENPIINDTEYSACDRCHSCKLAHEIEHPNISVVYSLPSGKAGSSDENPLASLSEDQISEIQAQIKEKAKNPYYKINIANARQIRIGSIRELKRQLTLSQSQSGYRCAIILEVNDMTQEAANAFLKTLEEPHSNTTILLTCSKKEALLDTILSRCQQIYVPNLSEQEIAEAIESRMRVDKHKALIAALAGEGSYSKATQVLDSGAHEIRDNIINILRSALKKGKYRLELLEKIDSICQDKNKNNLNLALNFLLLWLRDSYIFSKTQDDRDICNLDRKDEIAKFANFYYNANYKSAFDNLEYALAMIKGNVPTNLALVSAFIKIRKSILAN
jgi:DNA polymerase III subunit delta'